MNTRSIGERAQGKSPSPYRTTPYDRLSFDTALPSMTWSPLSPDFGARVESESAWRDYPAPQVQVGRAVTAEEKSMKQRCCPVNFYSSVSCS